MKIAALDIGLKRIGVAYSPDGKMVFPQNALIRRGRREAARKLSALLKELGIDTVVVGIPRGGSSEEEMERRIRHFVSLLEFDEGVRLFYEDEAGSSAEAKELMRGEVKQKRDGRIDSIAAGIVLQRWLDRNRVLQ
jgi:putative Holliday junction resolvase